MKDSILTPLEQFCMRSLFQHCTPDTMIMAFQLSHPKTKSTDRTTLYSAAGRWLRSVPVREFVKANGYCECIRNGYKIYLIDEQSELFEIPEY